jgi:signal transduction histidine kinase
VRHAIESNQAVVNLKSLNVKLELPETPLYALVDRERICQVATNLMSNAAEFTPNGGKIVWRLLQEPRWLVMSVCDPGSGTRRMTWGRSSISFFKAIWVQTRVGRQARETLDVALANTLTVTQS